MSLLRILLLALTMTSIAASPLRAESVKFAIGEWAPFISKDLPNYGPHAQKVTMIFKEMGLEAAFDFLPWKRAYNMTMDGSYPATFSWLATDQRRREMLFPQNPIAVSRNVVFYKKSKFPNGLKVSSLDDLLAQKLKIVGVSSYWYEAELKAKGARLHNVSRSELAWKVLNGDRADVYIEDPEVAKAEIIKALGEGSMANFGQTAPVKEDNMFILFSKNHPRTKDLVEKYDQAFEKLKTQGKL